MRAWFVKLGRVGVLSTLVLASGCRSRDGHMPGGTDGRQEAPDACGLFLFKTAQPCGGTVIGSGAAPTGSFSAKTIQADLGSSNNPFRLTLVITDAVGEKTVVLKVRPMQDAGTEIFFADHEAEASFYSAPTCATILTTARVQVTGGDDPEAAFGVQSGAVTGTFSMTAGGFSISASYQTPYCRFVSPNG